MFYSLVTARMERDWSTRTLSAAVAPQWQTAGPGEAIILHARGPQRSENETGFMAAGKDVNVKTKSKQPPWQTERRDQSMGLWNTKTALIMWNRTLEVAETKTCFFFLCGGVFAFSQDQKRLLGFVNARNKRVIFSIQSLKVDLELSKQLCKERWFSVIKRFLLIEKSCTRLPHNNDVFRNGPLVTLVMWLSHWPDNQMLRIYIQPRRFHPCVAVTSGQREEHICDWFFHGLHIYTRGLLQLGAHISTVSAPLGTLWCSPLQ